MVSSTLLSCSGVAPVFCGRFARTSSSTYCGVSTIGKCNPRLHLSYRNLKVDKLVREGGHGVVKAEAVLARVVRRENVVALALLLAV